MFVFSIPFAIDVIVMLCYVMLCYVMLCYVMLLFNRLGKTNISFILQKTHVITVYYKKTSRRKSTHANNIKVPLFRRPGKEKRSLLV